MTLDKDPPKEDEKSEKPVSQTIANAHASGDGSLERSEEDDLAKDDNCAAQKEPSY